MAAGSSPSPACAGRSVHVLGLEEGNRRVGCRPHIGKATGILPSHLMSQFPKVVKEAVLLYNPVCKILQNARCCCDV